MADESTPARPGTSVYALHNIPTGTMTVPRPTIKDKMWVVARFLEIPTLSATYLEYSSHSLAYEITHFYKKSFPGGSMVKNPPASAGDTGLMPGPGRSPREGNGTNSSILAGKTPWNLACYSPWSCKKSDTV